MYYVAARVSRGENKERIKGKFQSNVSLYFMYNFVFVGLILDGIIMSETD